jgi:Rifampin ADP-ribosyl transferase
MASGRTQQEALPRFAAASMRVHEDAGRLRVSSVWTAVLGVGDLLTPGRPSNYRPEIVMNHVYFTSTATGAALAAELAEQLTGGIGRVYEVEPHGAWEDDPNVTDKRFPGNPTRSYRSGQPLRIVHEVIDWPRMSPEDRQAWNERLAAISADPDAKILND